MRGVSAMTVAAAFTPQLQRSQRTIAAGDRVALTWPTLGAGSRACPLTTFVHYASAAATVTL